MKKYMALLALACVALLVVGSVAPAVAGKGAVKADLYVHGTTDVVGKVIVTPTAAGKVEVTVQIRDDSINTVTPCELVARVESWPTLGTFFKINAKGNGSAHISVPTTHTGPDTVKVEVWSPDVATGGCLYSADVAVVLK